MVLDLCRYRLSRHPECSHFTAFCVEPASTQIYPVTPQELISERGILLRSCCRHSSNVLVDHLLVSWFLCWWRHSELGLLVSSGLVFWHDQAIWRLRCQIVWPSDAEHPTQLATFCWSPSTLVLSVSLIVQISQWRYSLSASMVVFCHWRQASDVGMPSFLIVFICLCRWLCLIRTLDI